jgi:hypothetical protein
MPTAPRLRQRPARALHGQRALQTKGLSSSARTGSRGCSRLTAPRLEQRPACLTAPRLEQRPARPGPCSCPRPVPYFSSFRFLLPLHLLLSVFFALPSAHSHLSLQRQSPSTGLGWELGEVLLRTFACLLSLLHLRRIRPSFDRLRGILGHPLALPSSSPCNLHCDFGRVSAPGSPCIPRTSLRSRASADLVSRSSTASGP